MSRPKQPSAPKLAAQRAEKIYGSRDSHESYVTQTAVLGGIYAYGVCAIAQENSFGQRDVVRLIYI